MQAASTNDGVQYPNGPFGGDVPAGAPVPGAAPPGASGDVGALPRRAVVLAPDVPVGAGTLEVTEVPGAAAVDVGGAADVLAAAAAAGRWACVAPTCARATRAEPALRQTTARNIRASRPTHSMWIVPAHLKRHPRRAGHLTESSSRFWPSCVLIPCTSASIGMPARSARRQKE